MTPESELFVARIRYFYEKPVAFVQEILEAEPDRWQQSALEHLNTDPRIAMSACKGPGKSCLLAWVIWWFLTTRQDAQVFAVSITSDNLRDGLWKELAYWQSKSTLLQEMFTLTAERITNKERPRTWWCSARSFAKQADPEQQANTLAGFHADHLMIVLDEVGDYPEGVLSAAEAIFANPVDAHLIVAGNPTNVSGPLHRIMTEDSKYWHCIHITGDPEDPNRSPRISITWAQEQIDRWGRDNPWVMVNILGLFPPAGENQLIPVNLVTEAMQRDVPYLSYRTDAIVWGVDPSWSMESGADEAALARRQGSVARRFMTWRGLDGPDLANAVAKLMLEAFDEGEGPDAVFVDVGGVGASCYDHLLRLGYENLVIRVDFGGSPTDSRYANKRSEMWWMMKDWLKNGNACLPVDPVLRGELSAPEGWFKIVQRQTKFMLEPKDKMKARGLKSPNRADALACTFAQPVMPRTQIERPGELPFGGANRVKVEYDPMARR